MINVANNFLTKQVEQEQQIPNNNVSDILKWVSRGPRRDVIKYPGYIVNGCRYHTKYRDTERVNQNSGVSIVATTMQIASAKDKNPIISSVSFYGVISEIWLPDYITFKIPVFKCDWVDSGNGIKINELGYTLVELGKLGHKNDPFILASQAKQVFYVTDQLNPKLSIALPTPQRVYNNDDNDFVAGCSGDNALPNVFSESFDERDEEISSIYARTDCEGMWVEHKDNI